MENESFKRFVGDMVYELTNQWCESSGHGLTDLPGSFDGRDTRDTELFRVESGELAQRSLREHGQITDNRKRPKSGVRKLLRNLVAGGGFEPPTFGL